RGLNVDYLIEGAVRKNGEQIKISVQLFDSQKDETLWNESHKGVMDDIFDIQESVAKKTADSLKLSLSLEEAKILEVRPTENTKAYEYFLRAIQLADLNTRADFEKALVLLELAIELDPTFPDPFPLKALILSNFYRVYDNNPELIRQAEEAIENALAINSNMREAYLARATLSTIIGKTDDAIQAAHKVIVLNPNLTQGYFALGFAYSSLNDSQKAIEWYQKAKDVNHENTFAYWNIFVHSTRLGNQVDAISIANEAIPLYKRRLELAPNNQFLRSNLASFLIKIGNVSEAEEIINSLVRDSSTDSIILYNIACQYVQSDQLDAAMNTLRKAFKKGFRNIKLIQTDTDLDPLRTRKNFIQLLEEHPSE
ncbi:MAG TPA: tetratricopeptide repeat protein, partial [Candidatus Kapabacteria bacterium]